MRYISGLHEGETIRNVYLCKGKRSAETRNGKPYDNLLLQDKTGILDGKVWDPNSQGIADYAFQFIAHTLYVIFQFIM